MNYFILKISFELCKKILLHLFRIKADCFQCICSLYIEGVTSVVELH